MLDRSVKQIRAKLGIWQKLPAFLQETISPGKQIGLLRKVLGMTQEQLARRAKTNHRAIRRLEKEETDPRLSTLEKIAEELNCIFLVRMVPKTDTEYFVKTKAKEKAEKIIRMSSATANLEIQKPDEKVIREEINQLAEEILQKKKSSIWS